MSRLRVRLAGCCSVIAAVAALLAHAAPHPVPPAPTLEEAAQALRAGHPDVAARILGALGARTPKDPRVWRALGAAELQHQRPAAAVTAYERALALEPDAPQVQFGLGAAHAALHERAEALAWLKRARASRRFDMTELTVNPNLAPYRDDPEFTALLPGEAEFANPFVEPVRIIHTWLGEAAEDQFGWIARNIGDVDGDGVNDVVVSAPTHGADNSHAGRIYVYSGRSGQLLWQADGDPGDELGTGVEAAGDTDGDGIPDVVASGPAGHGVARIYSGRDGRVLHSFASPSRDETFGSHMAGAGDVDGDGCADVIVGSPGK
ncbi:MAG: FG-GAP repeat protein, partial [Gammaproteobacteria bacterium]|nr:FG-GAP repeat protein [Gammaproteobacteria bacterium]